MIGNFLTLTAIRFWKKSFKEVVIGVTANLYFLDIKIAEKIIEIYMLTITITINNFFIRNFLYSQNSIFNK